MKPRSLRGRVAVAAGSATAIVILVGGGLTTFLIGAAEHRALDRGLAEQAEEVEGPLLGALAKAEPVGSIEVRSLRPDVGTIVRVYRNGTFVGGAGAPQLTIPAPSRAGYENVTVEGRRWRSLSDVASTSPAGGNVVLQVAIPTTATDELVTGLREQVLIIGLISAALAAMGGWFAGGAALRPLGHLRATAELVSTSGDLSTRMPESEGPSEVDELAARFNVMLQRLQEASESTEAALASSRAFAGNAAHEMRTPLTSMQANLDVLLRNLDLPPQQLEEIVTSVAHEQQRLTTLLEALHTLARAEVVAEAQKERVDIADLAGIAVESARRNSPDAHIDFEMPAADMEITAWPDGLRVMVDNLLANAIRHGGQHVRVTVDRQGDAVRLTVEDDGPGVPVEERERIFERFFRGAGRRVQGSGLGLALVEQQVRLHGGSVSVSDSTMGGARFQVELRGA